MVQRVWVLIALAVTLAIGFPGVLAAQEATPQAEATPVSSPAHGALLPVMDLSVQPGEDFYRYATGGWQDSHTIPPDEAHYSTTTELRDRTIEQLLGLLDHLKNSDELVVGSDEWKAVQLFAQAMDMKTRNAIGLEPIQADLDDIDALANLDEMYAFVRDGFVNRFVYGFYGLDVGTDLADSSRYAVWYSGPSLGLPNRDYYWVDDEHYAAIRDAYNAMNAKFLEAAGYDPDQAAAAAAKVYDLEKRLAEPILRPEDFNDPANYYHPHPVADLLAANPDFDWPALLETLGIPDQKTIVVPEEKYLTAVDAIIADTDLQTLKDYLKLQVLQNSAPALTDELGKISFDFYGTTLNGVEEQRPLNERALGFVNGRLGFALGKLYVDEYFPPEAKAQIEELTKNVIAAARQRIEAVAWMSPDTKETALAKLDAMRVKVGYPDEWRTYEGVNIEETLPQTLLSASIAEAKRDFGRVNDPVDREEWGMLPQTVNAYYSPTNNEIVFPAAILQSPNFDYQADPAFNYGNIGATIGHEITHGFDQGGSQFDAKGNLVNWWTDQDRASFNALREKLAAQYDTIEVLPGLDVNGNLTIGENIADLGGLQIAHDALLAELAKNGDPGLIEGLTQEQRFFISFAYGWVDLARDEAIRTQVQTDEHAPASVRAVQPSRNMEAFFDAFGIGPDDPEYLAPDQRIVIW
ncbi:MAG: M13 family metallopeptidase [Thermomicrobiales bacterium]